jgi:group I intron endonuclease
MLLFVKISQVLTIPLASIYLSTILSGSAFSIFLFLCLLSHDSSWSIEILGGLFQSSLLYQIPISWVLDYSLLEEFEIFFSIFVPIMIYSNADSDKLKVLADNKGKAGIYQWTHIKSGRIYIGSAYDLSSRLNCYFNKRYLERDKNLYICNSILHHGYSSFSLTILEYIDITGLSKKDARKLILLREQLYLDTLNPGYNVLKTAGSTLGYIHSEETKNKISKSLSGSNSPYFGKTLSAEVCAKLSESKKGKNNPRFGKSALNARNVYIYSLDNLLVKECLSIKEAAEWLETYRLKVRNCISNKEVFDNKYIIRDTIIKDHD